MDIDTLQKASEIGLTVRLTMRNYFNAVAQAAADAATQMDRHGKSEDATKAAQIFREEERNARAFAAKFVR